MRIVTMHLFLGTFRLFASQEKEVRILAGEKKCCLESSEHANLNFRK